MKIKIKCGHKVAVCMCVACTLIILAIYIIHTRNRGQPAEERRCKERGEDAGKKGRKKEKKDQGANKSRSAMVVVQAKPGQSGLPAP